MKEDRVITPTNQVRLTNVSVVRLNRGGRRFEVACYKNKIVNYRQGIETDLTEVLQTTRIFSNVSKGEFAPSASLKKAFNTTDENEICNWILAKGQIQVSNLERSAKLENAGLEIATMISERCVNIMSQRRFTTQAIRDAMKEAEFCVHPRKDVKQQFLDCVKLLKEKGVLPIERAKMRLLIVDTQENGIGNSNNDDHDKMKSSIITDKLTELTGVKEIVNSNENRVTFLADPSLYRIIDKLVKDCNEKEKNQWRLEILQHCVFQEGEVNLESEMERKEQLALQQQKQIQQQLLKKKVIDHDIDNLSNKLQTAANIKNENKTDDKEMNKNLMDDEYDLDQSKTQNNRKKQKKAQKKSKKAKRREMEEEEERLERQKIEKERQAKRKEKLAAQSVEGGKGETSKSSKDAPLSKSTLATNDTPAPACTPVPVSSSSASTKQCNTCGGSFTVDEYRAHFRSEWHRHNLKLKMKGIPVVTEEEYENREADIYIE